MNIENRISKHFPISQKSKSDEYPIKLTCSGVKYYTKPHEYYGDQFVNKPNQCIKCYWYAVGMIFTDAFRKYRGN